MSTSLEDGRQTRTAERILDAAAELFFTNGYTATSVREIMRACNVTAASLYNHYPSKEDVLYAILMRSMEDSFAALQTAIAATDDAPTVQLRALVRTISTFHSERQVEGLVSQTEWRHLPPERAAEVLHLQKQIRRLFERTLQRGIDDGEFTLARCGIDVDIAAKAILDLCIHAGKWFRAEGRIDSRELARQHVEMVSHLVGATPEEPDFTPGGAS